MLSTGSFLVPTVTVASGILTPSGLRFSGGRPAGLMRSGTEQIVLFFLYLSL